MEREQITISDTVLNSGILTFREFIMNEPLPLAAIHEAIFEFLQGRTDVAVFGAHAVNYYVSEPRMTQDIDMISPNAETLSQELQNYLNRRFHIAVRVRKVSSGKGYRLYQVRKSGNRHLADVRIVEKLPETQLIGQIKVIAPADLIAGKVISYFQRRGKPKSGTDWRDLAMLLLTFPELKCDPGPVTEKLQTMGADIMDVWRELLHQNIQPENEDDF
ncbi:MAG: nucleotidyl transferase AbiEii/AbiGii toxin family protein [Desulfobacteraceae bacterium]|nr:nucleotidyl transferase AbiEii/AbiGii toxin family protein [Desulfobacteraceae bacterium]